MKEVEEQFGAKLKLGGKFISKKTKDGEKIFYYTGDEMLDIPVEWTGLHFGTIKEDGFMPSIDGAQLIIKEAKKNVLEVSMEDAVKFMGGEDLELNNKLLSYVILVSNDKVVGVGYALEDVIKNVVPKSRLIRRDH